MKRAGKPAEEKETSMRQDYFFIPTPTGENENAAVPLFINCAGVCEGTLHFSSLGRRDHTLYYIGEGEMHFSVGGEPPRALTAGGLLVIPPHTPFSYESAGATLRCYWMHFTGNHAAALLAQCGFAAGGFFTDTARDDRLLRDFYALFDEMKNPPDPLTQARAAACACLLLCDLARGRREEGQRLQTAFCYLQEHYTEPIDKAALAATEGLGLSQFNLLFRRYTGTSVAAYQTALRMKKACELLQGSDLSILEIAARCGYEDPLYFSRAFRRERGLSPRAWRAAERARLKS